MYRIPADIDLSKAVGHITTQLCVGQFDLQFTIGYVHFAVTSFIKLVRNNEVIGTWDEGRWPDPAFYDLMNTNVSKFSVPSDQLIILYFENGIEMHLADDSNQYECMQISVSGDALGPWII